MTTGDSEPGEYTRALHGPAQPAPVERAIAPPVWRSTTYAFHTAQDYADVLGERTEGYSYARIANPTADGFAASVAALEGVGVSGEVHGEAFASGMAAICTVLLTVTRAGSHVVAPTALYGGTYGVLSGLLERFGVSTTYVDVHDIDAVAGAVRPDTALIWAETIANPTLAVADIPRLAYIASASDVPLVVDSTFASPAICRPLALGADLVVHSATKYLGGHSDATGGVVVGRPELLRPVRAARAELGGSLAPDEAFLLSRGLQTLPLRVQRHSDVALQVAQKLAGHRNVSRVDYPGLAGHPDHALATRLFAPGRFGGVVTVTPRGGHDAGMALCDGLRLVAIATSLGGTHSLASHVASSTHRQLSETALAAAGIDPGAVRISCGLEDAEDLVADIEQALDRLS